jgi:hypothetical protein
VYTKLGADPDAADGVPTTQLVPTTVKSEAAKPVRSSVLPTRKLSVAERFGVLGAVRVTVGGPRSIKIEEAVKSDDGPIRDWASVNLLAINRGARVPSPQPETETVKLVPLLPLTSNWQFGAFPEFKKSSELSPLTVAPKTKE